MSTGADLRRAAVRRGIETRWRDTHDVWHDVGDDTLAALLSVLGPEPEPAPIEPITIATGGVASIGATRAVADAALAIDHRSAERSDPATAAVRIDGAHIGITGLPVGRHRLDVAFADGSTATVTIIAAPPRSLPAPSHASSVFVPTYALHRPGLGHGAGDLADLGALAAGLRDHGIDVMTILPIHPIFCGDSLFDPSPYSPITRLHWSELVADLSGLPGPDGAAFDERARRRAAELAAAPLVDWRGVARLVHDVLDRALMVPLLAAEVEAFAAAEPDVLDYARFRAHVDQAGAPPPHDTRLDQPVLDPAVARHVLGQLLVRRQLDDLGTELGRRGQILALDLPVGSHPSGHEAWQRHRSYALGASVGAPPDDFFVGGQNWGFPPLHPERARADGHQVWHDVIDAVAGRCGLLRIDHVMALHRLWWIPDGGAATDGAYVRFRPDELWATVATTSVLRDTVVVGEDLGTVPDEVAEARRSWAVLGMYEEQFTADRADPDDLPAVPADVVAGIRTHDMMPFAAFATGSDIDLRASLGIAAPDGASADDRAARLAAWRRLLEHALGHPVGDQPDALLAAALERLGASDASIVVVDIDDLTASPMPHNVPGVPSYPGAWSRRTTADVDTLVAHRGLGELLVVLAGARAR